MSRHRVLLASAILAIASTGILAPGAAAAQATGRPSAVLDEAQRLIEEGRPADAHRLLATHELELAGQPLFDYLIGVAALDSGHATEAIGAFERVLASQPRSASARLELGRALYEAGDHAAARRQFDWLLKQDPAPAVRETAEAYLQAMDARAPATGGWTREFEFGSGYDSNANASTGDRTFVPPGSPPAFVVVLDPTNVETSSPFASLSFALGNTRPVGAHNRLVTAARIGHRWNPDASFVDQTIASLDSVLQFGDGPTVVSLGAGGYYGLLDGDSHQWGASADLSLSHRFGDGWEAMGLLRAGMLRYEDDFPSLAPLEVDQQLAAFSLQHAGANASFGITAFAGSDDPKVAGSAFANERLGAQFHAAMRNAAGNSLQFQLGYQDVDYDDQPGFFFGTDRADRIWSAAVAGEIRDWPAPKLDFLPRIGWLDNDSNISLYEYDRLELSLTLRRSFR